MDKYERKLYQDNTLGYLLILLHVALNVIYIIVSLNNIEIGTSIGLFIIIAIAMLLLGFLIAVRVRIYSLVWSVVAIAVGLFQISRLFFLPVLVGQDSAMFIKIMLVLSALACLAGGIVSVRESSIHKSLLEKNNKAN